MDCALQVKLHNQNNDSRQRTPDNLKSDPMRRVGLLITILKFEEILHKLKHCTK